ncbi:MAG: mannitol dehydrogenase family protein [Hyphomicrobiales bacterium]
MRLSAGTMPTGVKTPAYDREKVTAGIVHLGIGAFHRGHMAAYVDACLASDPSWGICGVSLRSPSTRDALAPQDGLYTLGIQSGDGLDAQIIGAIIDLIVAPQEPQRLAEALLSPDTKIVSLTVTEKGYCLDPATGRLAVDHPDIQHDLTSNGHPRSAIGWLALGLLERRAAGLDPFTVLSCDNLPSNGRTLRRVLLDYIALKAPDAVEWAQTNIACPCTMVDRIVPATTDEDRTQIADALGMEDAWPIMTEPFSQFVVEDHFPLGRPAWEAHGVTMAQHVEPFERMKLGMLNGSHSTLAYLGYLAGDETVADTMADPSFRQLIHNLMTHEVMPTLSMPDGVDLPAYRDALLERFSNTALKHRTWQIAMDGSQKLPQRLLGTIRDQLAAGRPIAILSLGVAAWMRYACGRDEHGNAIDVRDPLAGLFAEIAEVSDGSAADLMQRFLAIESIFGTDLPSDAAFKSAVTKQLKNLMENGARATIAASL